jgi:hypothetical protein
VFDDVGIFDFVDLAGTADGYATGLLFVDCEGWGGVCCHWKRVVIQGKGERMVERNYLVEDNVAVAIP